MNLEEVIKEYNEAIFDTDRDRALRIVHAAVARGVSPEDVVFKIVLPAMDVMVRAVSEDCNANLAQHFLTGRIADAITAEMVPKFRQAPELTGRVIIGTSHGDLHTLGKRIVIGCLRARMIEVVDLGVNVPAVQFVDSAVSRQAEVIAISALMVHTANSELGCRLVRQILRERGLEDRIKVIIGGAPFRFDPGLFRVVGADASAPDAVAAGPVVRQLIMEVRR